MIPVVKLKREAGFGDQPLFLNDYSESFALFTSHLASPS